MHWWYTLPGEDLGTACHCHPSCVPNREVVYWKKMQLKTYT